jgi:hypothetical protein
VQGLWLWRVGGSDGGVCVVTVGEEDRMQCGAMRRHGGTGVRPALSPVPERWRPECGESPATDRRKAEQARTGGGGSPASSPKFGHVGGRRSDVATACC